MRQIKHTKNANAQVSEVFQSKGDYFCVNIS